MSNKKIFVLAAFLLVYGILISGISYASGFDVSIDRVKVNGNAVAESRTNLIDDADLFSVNVDFTAVETLTKGHVEAILRGRQSNDVVSSSTATFDLAKNQSSTASLALALIDSLKRETEFDLTVKIVDVKGNSEQKIYGIKTKQTRLRGVLDVSIDRVKVNNKAVAPSRNNFIDESNDFDVLVEFTAIEDLVDAHIEVILKDLNSGNVVADASPNFDLDEDLSSSALLRLELLDKLKRSNSFELTVKIIDADGNSVQQVYGVRMGNGNGVNGRILDISIDSIEVESKVVAENENNFVVIGEGKKELGLRVRLTSLENVDNARIEAVLTFESGDAVADATTTFDINKGESAAKKLELPLISKFEQNSFKLRVKVVDAEGDSVEKVYGLKISQKMFPFVISSISLEPEDSVEAGKNLVARLIFKNSGVVPLEGITAKVSIPELGVSSTKFVDQVENSGRLSIDFALKILDNAQTGTYTVRSEIASQFGGESEVKEMPVFIVGRSDQITQVVNDRLVIAIPIIKQAIHNDGRESIYPITLTNEGPDANAYALLLDGAGWADLRLAESNTFVLKPKESKTVYVYASSKGNVIGEQIFVVTVKGDDNVLKQIPLKGDVTAGRSDLAAALANALVKVLIGIVVLLVLVGLFFGVRRYFQGETKGISEEIPDEAEAYY